MFREWWWWWWWWRLLFTAYSPFTKCFPNFFALRISFDVYNNPMRLGTLFYRQENCCPRHGHFPQLPQLVDSTVYDLNLLLQEQKKSRVSTEKRVRWRALSGRAWWLHEHVERVEQGGSTQSPQLRGEQSWGVDEHPVVFKKACYADASQYNFNSLSCIRWKN